MQEEKKKIRPPLEIWKDTLLKIQFGIFRMDCDIIAVSKTGEILAGFEKEFYFRQGREKAKIGWLERRRFEADYKRHREKYPSLFSPEMFKIELLTQAVPGNPLDKNLLMGYFRELKTTEGNYFINLFGNTVEPLMPSLAEIAGELKRLTVSLDPGSEKHSRLTVYLQDIKWIREIGEFLKKVYVYADQNHFAHLKSGHLAAYFTGMVRFFTDLLAELRQMGFAAVSVESPFPLYALTDGFITRAVNGLNELALDMMLPLAEGAGWKVSVTGKGISIEYPEKIERGFFSSVFDFFARLFGGKNKKSHEENNISEDKKETPGKKADKKTGAGKAAVIDGMLFSDLSALLTRFADEIRSDLAPQYDEKGAVSDYRSMFDQMDVQPADRKAEYSTHILRGRLQGVDPLDPKFKDQTIIGSTYWLYDRIRGMVNGFHASKEGALIDDARRFSEEVRDLFLTPRHELNETLQYGNFPQFKINVRRLFSANTTHDKYFGLINLISEQLNKAREYLLGEEKKVVYNKNIK